MRLFSGSHHPTELNEMNDALTSFLDYLRENWPELLWIVAAAGVAS